jgi:hypothetical protein
MFRLLEETDVFEVGDQIYMPSYLWIEVRPHWVGKSCLHTAESTYGRHKVLARRKIPDTVEVQKPSTNIDYTAELAKEIRQWVREQCDIAVTLNGIHELATRLNSVVKAQ